jgi:hypothetical protein
MGGRVDPRTRMHACSRIDATCRAEVGIQQLGDAGEVQIGITHADVRAGEIFAVGRRHDDHTRTAAGENAAVLRVRQKGDVSRAGAVERRHLLDQQVGVAMQFAAQPGDDVAKTGCHVLTCLLAGRPAPSAPSR